MFITGILIRKSTPVFRVQAPKDSFFARVWGGVYADGSWLFPAYHPFAAWVFDDIRKLYPSAAWDDTAVQFLRDAKSADLTWQRVQEHWEKTQQAAPVAPDTFFPQAFTPYQHQHYGIHRLLTWWRSFLIWEMGTGKTRTVIDALRANR